MGKVAQRVQLQNRAQALSLPIPNLALVHDATQIATRVAGRVGKAMGFDEVLRGGAAAQVDSAEQGLAADKADAVPSISDLHARISSRIRSLMKDAGMAVSGALEIRFDSRQNLSVENPHPSGAGIEELLNRDSNLKQDFESLARLTARNDFSIDLTSHGPVANMSFPGGYPNW